MTDDQRKKEFVHLMITDEEHARILKAYGIPAGALGTPPDGLVHWRGLDEQETFTPFGVVRPTRCGQLGIATLGYPLDHVTCPKCRELAEADDA